MEKDVWAKKHEKDLRHGDILRTGLGKKMFVEKRDYRVLNLALGPVSVFSLRFSDGTGETCPEDGWVDVLELS